MDIDILGVSVLDIPIVECRWKDATTFNAINVLFHREEVQWPAISGKFEAAVLALATFEECLLVCTVLKHC